MKYRFLTITLTIAGLCACRPSYSPDTYASNAAQQANKVEQGTVIGVRVVGVSAVGAVGTVSGAAAGGIAGSEVGGGAVSALSALGGGLVGGIAGSTVEHVTSDTKAFEYIVRKLNGDLVSVTQKDKTPLALGQKVLVIAGTQARVVPDYTVPAVALPPKPGEAAKTDGVAPEVKPTDTKPGDPQPAGPAAQTPPSTTGAPPTGAQPASTAPPGTPPATTTPRIASPAATTVQAAPPVPVMPSGAQPAPIILQGARPAAITARGAQGLTGLQAPGTQPAAPNQSGDPKP